MLEVCHDSETTHKSAGRAIARYRHAADRLHLPPRRDAGLSMGDPVTDDRVSQDPERPVYVISVAAELVRVHPRTLRIYELEGLLCPARTRSNIRLYSENDIRRVLWIRHLTRNLGVNLAGVRVLFELEERLGTRILETLYEDRDGARRAASHERRGSRRSQDRAKTDQNQKPNPTTRKTRTRLLPAADQPAGKIPRSKMTETIDNEEQVEQETRRWRSASRELPLVALRETVIFPEMIVPLQVGRDKSVQALNKAVADSTPIALVTQRQADREDINDPAELYEVGTLAKIAQVVQLQDGTVRAIVQGQQRLRLLEFVESEPFILARVELVEEEPATGLEVQALVRTVQGQIEAVRPVRRARSARGGRRRAQHHRARPAGRHGRLQPGHDHRAAPGAARDDRRPRAPEARLQLPRAARSRSSS